MLTMLSRNRVVLLIWLKSLNCRFNETELLFELIEPNVYLVCNNNNKVHERFFSSAVFEDKVE